MVSKCDHAVLFSPTNNVMLLV